MPYTVCSPPNSGLTVRPVPHTVRSPTHCVARGSHYELPFTLCGPCLTLCAPLYTVGLQYDPGLKLFAPLHTVWPTPYTSRILHTMGPLCGLRITLSSVLHTVGSLYGPCSTVCAPFHTCWRIVWPVPHTVCSPCTVCSLTLCAPLTLCVPEAL